LEALGHALDHVGQKRAGQAVEASGVAVTLLGSDKDLITFLLDRDLRTELALEFALRSLDRHGVAVDGDSHTIWNWNRFLADARHLLLLRPWLLSPSHWRRMASPLRLCGAYQTWPMISPPRLLLRAWRSVIRPELVLMMAIPSPPYTRGT